MHLCAVTEMEADKEDHLIMRQSALIVCTCLSVPLGVHLWDVPIAKATVEGEKVRIGKTIVFDHDPVAGTLSGTMPKATRLSSSPGDRLLRQRRSGDVFERLPRGAEGAVFGEPELVG